MAIIRWFNEDTSLAIPKETILLSNIFRSERNQCINYVQYYCNQPHIQFD